MRISDWSSDVCSSDLRSTVLPRRWGCRCARAPLPGLPTPRGVRTASMIQASPMLCPLVRCVGWSPVASLRPLPTIHGSTPYWQRTLPTPAEAAASGAVALQEVEDDVVEDLVAIAGHHVARAGDVCVLGVRHPPQDLAGPVLAPEVAAATADEQRRHLQAVDGPEIGRAHV